MDQRCENSVTSQMTLSRRNRATRSRNPGGCQTAVANPAPTPSHACASPNKGHVVCGVSGILGCPASGITLVFLSRGTMTCQTARWVSRDRRDSAMRPLDAPARPQHGRNRPGPLAVTCVSLAAACANAATVVARQCASNCRQHTASFLPSHQRNFNVRAQLGLWGGCPNNEDCVTE